MLTFGKDARAFPSALTQKPILVGGAGFYAQELLIPVVGLLLMGGVQLFYHRTAYGKHSRRWPITRGRGPDGDPHPAGGDVRLRLVGAARGIAGILLAPILNVAATMGSIIGLKAFAVAIIGGLTSARGSWWQGWATAWSSPSSPAIFPRAPARSSASPWSSSSSSCGPGASWALARRARLMARVLCAGLFVAGRGPAASHGQHLLPLRGQQCRAPHHRDGRPERPRRLQQARFRSAMRVLRHRRLRGRGDLGPLGAQPVAGRAPGHSCRCGRGGRGGRGSSSGDGPLPGDGHHRLRDHRRRNPGGMGRGHGRTRRHLQHSEAAAGAGVLDHPGGGGAFLILVPICAGRRGAERCSP